jgi:hypothetical protein
MRDMIGTVERKGVYYSLEPIDVIRFINPKDS